MYFGSAILLFAGCIIAVYYYMHQLVGEGREDVRRWFWTWFAKGLGLPVLFWIVWNTGILPGLPALLFQMVQAGKTGSSQVEVFFYVTSAGLMVMGSYWAAVSLAWFLVRVSRRDEIRSDFFGACLIWSCIMIPVGWFIVHMGGWMSAGLAAVAWLLPIAHSSVPLVAIKKAGPMYSRAVARMKMWQYEDAEWEILRQLEGCEDDFDGWMMLADLYANQFNDLGGAERTIYEICSQPKATPSQISVALHKLADWQLKTGRDPVAARHSLETICEAMPGTHLATMARHRINQLPASREELRRQREGTKIRLPALTDEIYDGAAAESSADDRQRAAAEANRCVEELKRNPDNVPAREELARLFTERLGKAGLGIEQLELLLEMPEQPRGKCAEWLGLMAAWELKHRQNGEAAQAILRRILKEYPESVQAFSAQRHLKLIEVEARLRQVRAGRRGEGVGAGVKEALK